MSFLLNTNNEPTYWLIFLSNKNNDPSYFLNVFESCPLLGQLFLLIVFYREQYYITFVALLSAAVAAAAAGYYLFEAARAALCCWCYSDAIAAAAAVGSQATSFLLRASLAASLPRAATSCSNCCGCCRTLGRTIVCITLLPLPGLELKTAPLASQPTTVPARQDLFNQAQPGKSGSILEHSADANPQFWRGSVADRLHTSPLSLSTNCSVTAPRYRGQQKMTSFSTVIPIQYKLWPNLLTEIHAEWK